MLNMNNDEALGVIFPNSYDALIPELVTERLMASIPFAGRYRMCDFIISSMVHSGIANISLIVRQNYLLKSITNATQVVITSVDTILFEDEFLKDVKIYNISDGNVS